MTHYETLDYAEGGGIAWVTLNRPESHNSFNQQMMREVHHCWRQLRANDDVRVIVLSGAGDEAFCAGLDRDEIDHVPAMTGVSAAAEGLGPVGETPLHPNDPADWLPPHTAADLWKPVIAAVNGMCLGGAFYLLAEADIIIAAEHATFFDPHVSYGLAAVYESIMMAQRMPLGEVMRMSLLSTGERMTAGRAREIGMVQEVVPADGLRAAALHAAEIIAAQPPLAVQATVRSIWYAQDLGYRQALDVAKTMTMLATSGTNMAKGQDLFRSGWRGKWQLR